MAVFIGNLHSFVYLYCWQLHGCANKAIHHFRIGDQADPNQTALFLNDILESLIEPMVPICLSSV